MIELSVLLVLLPTVGIWGWNACVMRMSLVAWDAYKLTGIIGTPIHELSHAITGLMFGLRIERMALFEPNAITGTLGYVRFKYRPGSAFNNFGLALQGVAPLATGALIVCVTLGHYNSAPMPNQGWWGLAEWVPYVVSLTMSALVGKLQQGVTGVFVVGLILIIALHSIPSKADIAVGLKGLMLLAISFGALGIGLTLLYNGLMNFENGKVGMITAQIIYGLEIGMIWALFGVVSVVTLSVMASIMFVLLPTITWFALRFIRGARGHFE